MWRDLKKTIKYCEKTVQILKNQNLAKEIEEE